ncbi:MAG TPA: hypothetical protein VFM63_11275 [Pyrinomonadaceae bacterium]|nr:hypothetical protein [Pyrinomonadaceae bacterium]
MKQTIIEAILKRLSADGKNESNASLYQKVWTRAAVTIALHIGLSSSPRFAWYFFTSLAATLVPLTRLLARLTWPIIQHRLLRSASDYFVILYLRDEFIEQKLLRNNMTLTIDETARLDLAEYDNLQMETEMFRATIIDRAYRTSREIDSVPAAETRPSLTVKGR